MQQPSTTTGYEPGDVVMVRFRFRDEPHPQLRPAVIISVAEFQDSRRDAVMVAVSTRTDRAYFGDSPIHDLQAAGLDRQSKAKGIFRTFEQSQIKNRIGHLADADKARLDDSLREIFGL